MKLSFHGGAREVTGACYLLESEKTKILADCGLFQGCDECSDLNFEMFKFNPRRIDALLVSHAHLDHVGRIPKLARDGFSGAIYSTAPTKELALLLLDDALSIAERQGKKLYEKEDINAAARLWKTVSYGEEFEIGTIRARFNDAGHILGSALIELWAEGKHLLITGDLGNSPSILLPSPQEFHDLTHLVIESAYGNRTHEDAEERTLLFERAVEDIASRGGALMIPAFAAERTQDILFLLNSMLLFKRIPEIPVFVDAPLAIRVTRVFERYVRFFKKEIQELFLEHPSLFRFKKLTFTNTVEESKAINNVPPPKVILAGSGMMNGGRILHHARRYLSDPKSILLFVGFQPAGSLGRRLIDGASVVKILGDEISAQADIRTIHGFSAHADNPQLFSFINATRDTLEKVFVVQGEEAQALHLMQEAKDRLGVQASTPALYEEFSI